MAESRMIFLFIAEVKSMSLSGNIALSSACCTCWYHPVGIFTSYCLWVPLINTTQKSKAATNQASSSCTPFTESQLCNWYHIDLTVLLTWCTYTCIHFLCRPQPRFTWCMRYIYLQMFLPNPIFRWGRLWSTWVDVSASTCCTGFWAVVSSSSTVVSSSSTVHGFQTI